AVPSPDGRSVVYAGAVAAGDTIKFLDRQTGQLKPPVIGRRTASLAAWLPPDDRLVVTVAARSLQVRDRENNQTVRQGVVVPTDISAVAASSDGKFVVVGESSGGVDRIDIGTLRAAGPRIDLGTKVTAVATGPGDMAVALLADKSFIVLDLADGSMAGRGDLGIKATSAPVSPHGERLLVGGSAGEVGLLDLDWLEWIATPIRNGGSFVDGASFSSDGATMVTSSLTAKCRSGMAIRQSSLPVLRSDSTNHRLSPFCWRTAAPYLSPPGMAPSTDWPPSSTNGSHSPAS
ncbi:MAG: WD40 repeat domain-containing protein, partial [Nakamurella sp.]